MMLIPVIFLTNAMFFLLSIIIFYFSLPLSFLIYAAIASICTGILALGTFTKQILELKDLAEKKSSNPNIKQVFEYFLERVENFENIMKKFGFWIFEVSNGIIRNSKFSEKILGYSDDEINGKRVEDVFISFRDGECEVRRKDGKIVPVKLLSYGNFFAAIDLEKEKKMMQEITFLRAILEHSADAIVVLDENTNIISWNKGAETIFGYKAEEVIGKPFTFLLPKDQHEFCRQNFRKAVLDGYVKDIESTRITKDGKIIFVEQTLTTIKMDDEIVGFVSIMRDITKKKETENILIRTCDELEKKTKELYEHQKKLELFAKIFESSNDAIYLVDSNGIIRAWNKTAENLFGWKAEEIIGKDSTLLLPDEIKNETNFILKMLREGEREIRFETRRISKNGEIICVEVTVSPIPDEGFSVIARKIEKDDFEKKILKFNIEKGRTYFTRNIDLAIEALKDLISVGYSGVIFSRRYPEDFKVPSDFFWLSERSFKKLDDIYNLVLSTKGWKVAALLDIDYLLINFKFEDVFALIQKLKDAFYILNKGVLIIYSNILGEQEEKIIKSECSEIFTKTVSIPSEAFEVLKVVYQKNKFGERPSIKDIMDELKVTRNTAKKRINYLAQRGLIKIIKDGRTKVLEVTEEGKVALDSF